MRALLDRGRRRSLARADGVRLQVASAGCVRMGRRLARGTWLDEDAGMLDRELTARSGWSVAGVEMGFNPSALVVGGSCSWKRMESCWLLDRAGGCWSLMVDGGIEHGCDGFGRLVHVEEAGQLLVGRMEHGGHGCDGFTGSGERVEMGFLWASDLDTAAWIVDDAGPSFIA
ncbi:hypothetical protein ACLOJK_036387, partial [Asimina triloba]